MPLLSTPYYFTAPDPDYSIKGSRDPLGFQVLWQQQAHHLIPFLSTVSNSLQDFQILCLAHFLYGSEVDTNFSKFFLRLEQAFSYTRYHEGERGFNGYLKVKRRYDDAPTTFSLSNSSTDEILSNQRAYGIWGKYSRPFRDMDFINKPEYPAVFSHKINTLPYAPQFLKLIARIMEKQALKIGVEELDLLATALEFTVEELEFYKNYILLLPTSHNPYQNQLFAFLQQQQLPEEFDFYSFLHSFKNSSAAQQEALQSTITDIEQTEKILCPLHTIFRYLQTKPMWTSAEIENNDFISHCKLPSTHLFSLTSEASKTKNQLSLSLSKPNWNLVLDLVARNTEVSAWRGGAPWMGITGEVLEVHHNDGADYNPEFNPMFNWDNNYFIKSYIQLYNQIIA